MQQPAWMDHAWAALGQAERQGDAANRLILGYFQRSGRADVGSDEVPWCAAFVGACLADAGIAGTGSLMARSYLAWGAACETPRLGTVCVLRRGRDEASGHVGFLVGAAGDRLLLLGGNQSNRVSVAPFPRADLLGFREPSATTAGASMRPDSGEDAFEPALAHVLQMEGGFTDDPHDPGGPTNRGITLATFAAHRGTALTPASRASLVAELQAIGREEVRSIYLARYWRPSRAHLMPAGIALMHFDASVNHGVAGAARMLQGVLAVDVDGEIGPLTLAAIATADPARLLSGYADARRERYRRLPHAWRFGRGWQNRVTKTLAASQAALAAAAAHTSVPQNLPQHPPQKLPPNQPQGASTMADDTLSDLPVSTPPRPAAGGGPGGKWWGESLTIWGAIITTLATVLPVVGPFIGLDITADLVRQLGAEFVKVAQALAGLAGVAMTIYGRARATTPLVRRDVSLRL